MKRIVTKIAFFLGFSALFTRCGTDPVKPSGVIFKMPERRSVLLPNGETYAYFEQGAELQSEDNTFLLIHGNMASSMHMLPLFWRMNDVYLVAPDLRGFGNSSYNAGFDSLDALTEDLKLFTEKIGISKVHIVGWSLGGGIALAFAARYPAMVASLFIIEGMSHKGLPFFKSGPGGTFIPYESKEEYRNVYPLSAQLAAIESKDSGYFEQSWNSFIYPVKKPTAAESRYNLSETLKQRSLADVYWALAWFNMSAVNNGYTDGSGTVGSITCPVAFTCADRDMVILPAVIRDNAAAIPGSEILEYANCGHSPLVDCPDRLAADILKHSGL